MNILPPKLESHRYDTYGIIMPKDTHMRVVPCQEATPTCTAVVKVHIDGTADFCQGAHCGPHTHGWETLVDVSTVLGQKQARYIIDHSGRHWTAKQEGDSVTFTFPSGQKCFSEHRVPLDRPPIFTIKHEHLIGHHSRPAAIDGYEWLDRFGNNQLTLKEMIERG